MKAISKLREAYKNKKKGLSDQVKKLKNDDENGVTDAKKTADELEQEYCLELKRVCSLTLDKPQSVDLD